MLTIALCFFYLFFLPPAFFLILDLGPLSFFGGLLPCGLTSLQGSSEEISSQTE